MKSKMKEEMDLCGCFNKNSMTGNSMMELMEECTKRFKKNRKKSAKNSKQGKKTNKS